MKTLTNSTLVGLFLLLSSVGMELFGLFTQYILGFEPCANCVQIRLFILFIGVAGILHLFAQGNAIAKTSTLLLAMAGAGLSLLFSWDNHLVETGQKLSTCGFGSPFPSFLPLDTWMPVLFEAQGPCGTPSPLYGNITFTDLSIWGLSLLLVAILLLLSATIYPLVKFGVNLEWRANGLNRVNTKWGISALRQPPPPSARIWTKLCQRLC